MWNEWIGAAAKVVDLFSVAELSRARANFDSVMGSCSDTTSVRAEYVKITGDAGRRLGIIGFECASAEYVDRGLTLAKRDEFKVDFCREVTRLEKWAVDLNWGAVTLPELHVVVSDRYKISKSLVPAWSGQSGRMEFPLRRVMSREAAIVHELVHVVFPSGNRFLAEGLAVYVQAAIGGNPAFPNFGKPLHEHVREKLSETVDPCAGRLRLEQVHLAELDAIATPSRLTLRVVDAVGGDEQRGPEFTYPIAGSFVQFLIETRGMDMFNSLYEQAPFVPLAHKAGSPDCWLAIFNVTLADLEEEWKSMIVGGLPAANTPRATAG